MCARRIPPSTRRRGQPRYRFASMMNTPPGPTSRWSMLARVPGMRAGLCRVADRPKYATKSADDTGTTDNPHHQRLHRPAAGRPRTRPQRH